MTKRKSRSNFIIMSLVLLVGILLSVLTFDIPVTDYTYNGFIKAIPLGFDLQGGVSVVFEASLPDDNPTGNLSLGIEGTISRIELLLEEQGYTEHYVYKQGNNRIVVEVSKLTDTDYLFEKLNEPANFKITTENNSGADARLTGKDILNAGYSAQKGNDGQLQHGVVIAFNDEGKQKFATLTGEIASNSGTMYFFVGDSTTPLTSLTASAAITNGTVFISSSTMTENVAKDMSLKILSGSFESKLTLIENNIVSASLGMNALLLGTISVFVALLIALILMFVFYREFGLLSIFTTGFWTVLVIFFLQAVPFSTLSLSSFAGLILSILIQTLSFIIIHENIKNENAKGKKLHMSVKAGMKKSVLTIVDFHVLPLIASVIMLIMGSSTIKGFAVVLFLGVAVSLFTSLVLFRWFLNMYLAFNSTNVKKFNLEKTEVKFNEN